MRAIQILALLVCAGVSGFTYAANAAAQEAPNAVATIGAAKLIVDDLVETQAFYETLFGMQEVRRYDYDLDTFEETIMGFGSGARLALFAPNHEVEKPLKKSQFPVVLIYSPEFDAVMSKLVEMEIPHRTIPTGENGPKIVIARDPSGNAVEVYGVDGGEYKVGGSKLIVDDRPKAEAFYKHIFNAQSGQVYAAKGVYDEVLMDFQSGGTWLALFQPLAEDPLPKSRFPLTAFYTTDYDNVLARLEKEGYGYRTVATKTPGLRIVIARDPSGNAIEIIAR